MGKAEKFVAAGTTSLIAEPVMALTHQGGLGVIVALGIGAFTYAFIDSVEQASGRRFALPERPQREPRPRRQGSRGKASLGYRLLVGKDDRERDSEPEASDAHDDPQDEYVELEYLELGGLRIHVNSVFSRRTAIQGMSGAGKSNVVAVLVEELGQFAASLIVFDHKGEYKRLCSHTFLTTPVLANATNLTPQNARQAGARMVRDRLQVIVDLSSYERDADAALVMIGVVEGVKQWQKQWSDEERIPCTLILEEAHYWLPQDQSQSTLRGLKVKVTTSDGPTTLPLLSLLQQTWFNVATLGRSFGMGLVTATQRPANVDNRLISQAEWRFLLKAIEPADLDRYKGYNVPNPKEIAPALHPEKGEAYVIGPDGTRGVYHIRRRYSPDEAKSPGLANIRRTNTGNAPAALRVAGSEGYSHEALLRESVQQAIQMESEKKSDFPISDSPAGGRHTLESGWETGKSGNREMGGNGFPGSFQRRENSPAAGKISTDSRAMGNVEGDEEGYTHEEEVQVLAAYAAMLKDGEPVSRTAIRDRLEWSGRQYQRIVKPVCDKHGIA